MQSLSPKAQAELLRWTNRDLAAVDPVIFAEEFLDFNSDPWQADFLKSTDPRIILNCSRQSGKSTVTAILALWEAIYKPRSVIVLDSPSLRQSTELMIKFSEFLGQIDQKVKLDTDTKLSVRFSNGSRVLALPGSERTIRGLSAVTLFIGDEAAAIPDELYKSIRPMLAVSHGRLVLMSTPRGMQGFFWEIWERGEGWTRYRITADQCPRISPEFLEEERRELGPIWFEQEYFCQFVAAGATRIKREWLKYEDRPPQGLKIVMGVDLAISERESADYTAACVLGRLSEGKLYVLDVQRIRASFSQQKTFIKQLAEKWRPSVVGIEDVAYQKAMVQEISAGTSLNVKGVRPDRDKVSRFAPLEGRYERGEIVHLRDLPGAWETELLAFPAGNHDDMVDAMSIAWAAMGEGEGVTLSVPSAPIRGRPMKRAMSW